MNSKIGKNDACPCGSGKKHKNCCLKLAKALNPEFVDPDEVMESCGWCGKTIPDDSEIFSLGIKARPEIQIERFEGKGIVIKLVTIGNKIPALIPLNNSRAKKEGNDLLFAVCSEKCGKALKRVLNEERNMFERLN